MSDVPQRESQTQAETGRLLSAIQDLANTIKALSERLKNGIRQSTPVPEQIAKGKEHETLVPLADQIRKARLQIDELQKNVMSITEHLET